MRPLIKKVIIGFLFALLIIIPRYLASNLYGPLEDEILAIKYNYNFSASELFFHAPDVTHPGLWYIIMELPIIFFGYFSPIHYYRIFNIIIFTIFCLVSWIFFSKKYNKSFFVLFFGLLLSNLYLIHLTFQNRMYALVLGISILYSLYWQFIIDSKKRISFKQLLFLAVTAAAGFFTNYSFIWIIPIWPLVYSIQKKEIKSLLKFTFLLLLQTVWFIPIFIKNSMQSIENNQWAPYLNISSVKYVIENYFGVDSTGNWFFIFFLLLAFSPLIFKKDKNRISFFILVAVFLLYLLSVYLSGPSLLYARVSIPIVIVVYVILSKIHSYHGKKIQSFLLIFPIITIQLFQVFNYFSYKPSFDSNFKFWNYHENPLTIIQNYKFQQDSCLFVVPRWNEFSLVYFSKNIPNISIIKYDENKMHFSNKTKDCSEYYLLVQKTIPNKIIESDIKILESKHFKCENKMYSFENQDLYDCKVLR